VATRIRSPNKKRFLVIAVVLKFAAQLVGTGRVQIYDLFANCEKITGNKLFFSSFFETIDGHH